MNRKKTMKREYQAYLYILPWILGFAILQLYPFVSSFIYSFTDYTVGAKATFQGLANYKKLFTQDKEFWNSLKVTILFALYTVPGKLIMALAVAMFLNRDLKGINLIRTLYYIPSLFGGSVAVALLWRLMFLDNGVINAILSALHLPVIQWLGDTRYALRTICMLEIWQFGSSMVMFLAALKQVPRSLYEAAEIDGAGKVTRFFHITLPQISPIIFFNLINQLINGFMAFTQSYIITQGKPRDTTLFYTVYMYQNAFTYNKLGYGCALAWFMILVVGILTLILFKTQNKWVYYESEG